MQAALNDLPTINGNLVVLNETLADESRKLNGTVGEFSMMS